MKIRSFLLEPISKLCCRTFASIFSLAEAPFAGHTQRGSGQKRERRIKEKDAGKGRKIILRWVLFIFTYSFSYCQSDATTPPTIFGVEPLFAPGKDTIETKKGWLIVYDKDSCSLRAIDEKGKQKWNKNVKTYGCQLISFFIFKSKKNKKLKGSGDIVLQFKDNKIYSLHSRKGKVVEMTIEEYTKVCDPPNTMKFEFRTKPEFQSH